MKFLSFLALFFLLAVPGYASESAQLSMTLDANSPIGVVTPSNAGKTVLQLKNHSHLPQKVAYQVSWCVIDDRESGIFTGNAEISGGNTLCLPLPAEKKFGIRKVECELTGEKFAVKRHFSYAFLEPAGPNAQPKADFIFGVNTHTMRSPAPERQLEALAAATCGVQAVRDGVEWLGIQPSSQVWNFSATDELLELYGRYNIEWMPVLGFCAPWALDPAWQPVSRDRSKFKHNWELRGKPDTQAWAEYVFRTVERYRGKIRHVELWNEPDLTGFANFSLQDYLELLRAGYRAAKRADSDIRVLNGGFATVRTLPQRGVEADYLEKFLRRSEGKWFDVLAIHLHSRYAPYRGSIQEMLGMMAKNHIRQPWFPNETAYPAGAGFVTELEQAHLLWKKLFFSWANGAIGYLWYDLRNDGTDPANAEHNFGMITRDFQPKALYAAFNTLTRNFGDARFLRVMADTEQAEVLLFQKENGNWLIPFWANQASGSPVLLLSGISGSAEAVDLWGNSQPVPVHNGTICFTPEAQPGFLRISGAKPELQGEFIQLPAQLSVMGNEPTSFQLAIRNPLEREISGELEFRAPEKFTLRRQCLAFSVPAGQTATYRNVIAWDKGGIYPESPVLTVRCQTADFWSGNLDTAIHLTRKLRSEFAETPDFELNRVDQLVPLVPQMEAHRHLYWQSPDDLSAEIRFAVQEDKLLMQVKVRDDVHCQPYDGNQLWRGDSVQLALKLPRQNGIWELGFSHRPDGNTNVWCWDAPRGFAAVDATEEISLKTSRDEQTKQTIYHVEIPFHAIGLTSQMGKEGIRVNLLVNDNDGELRESFLRLASGMGESPKDAQAYPLLTFEEER